jgi:HEAT repeat protein
VGFLDSFRHRSEHPESQLAAEMKALKHPDAQRRSAAAETLAGLGAAAVPALLDALGDRHPGVRAGAAYALGRIGDRAAVEPLIDRLQDDDPHVRSTVVPALRRLNDRRGVASLVAALRDAHPSVRLQAAGALAGLNDPQAVPALIDALNDADAEVRRQAAGALGQLDDPQAVPALIDLLHDADREVRLQAAGALARIGDTRAVEPLMDRLTAQEDYARVQIVAVIGLGDLLDPRAIPPLVRILEIGDATFRSAAAEALGKIGLPRFANTDAVGPLIGSLRDEDALVRRLAARSLGQVADGQAVGPLRRTLQDNDDDVRTAAGAALQALEERGIDLTGPASPDDGGVTLIGREQKGRYSYIKYKGTDAAAARAFIKRKEKDVRKPNRYITVETPEGIWGVDKEGLYLVRLLPWQSDLSRAQCTGAVVEPPTPFSLQQAILQDAVDNYVATVQCGRCNHRWQDGLSHLGPTVVRCPDCACYNRIESAVRPE